MDLEPTHLPSALTALASYRRHPLISCKRHRTNSTFSDSVLLFAGRARCEMRRHFLAKPKASNAGPMVSSLITRSRFTTRPRIVPVAAGASQAQGAFHFSCSQGSARRESAHLVQVASGFGFSQCRLRDATT